MKSVLVTGGTGALGQALLTCMQKSGGYCGIAASRHPAGASDVQLDVRDREQLAAVIKNTEPDVVLHLAATFGNDFDEAYAINVEAARNLLEEVHQSGRPVRVVLIGSAAEYGVVRPEENPVREDRMLAPVSVYGLTKAWQTQLASLYASRGVDVVVARVFNLDGPGLSERLFIGRLQKQIDDVLADRKAVIELGPLGASRDYISTDDAAEQIMAIAAYAEPGRAYHVASGVPVTMREILTRRLAIYKLDASIVREASELTNRVGYDVPVIYADITSTMQIMKKWRTSV